jgi:hypothetical protein
MIMKLPLKYLDIYSEGYTHITTGDGMWLFNYLEYVTARKDRKFRLRYEEYLKKRKKENHDN